MKNIYQLDIKKSFLFFIWGLLALFHNQERAHAEVSETTTGVLVSTATVWSGMSLDINPDREFQTIDFPPIPEKTYGDAGFELGNASSDEGLTVIYAAADPSVVQIIGNTATILKAGSTSVTATQVGNTETSPATPVTQVLTVVQKELTVSANTGQSKSYGITDPVLTYSSSGFVNEDDDTLFEGLLSRDLGEELGTYAIRLGSLQAGDNYVIAFVTSDFEISPGVIKGVTLGDEKFVYDGTSHSLAISGSLPSGTSVAYSNNGRTDVGTQKVTATITGSNYITEVLTAELTVAPAIITGVTFEDGSFIYDNTVRSLAISGTIPSGTTVTYSNNGRTDVGTQEVTATIAGSNYITLVLTADLTITPVPVPVFAFNDESFVYDGTPKYLSIIGTIPVGTIVTYSNNGRTEVGTQVVRATISGQNYTPLVLTADLTITQAEITGITLDDERFVYDETTHSLEITGDLPSGTNVVYSNNGRVDVGTQEVTATISGDNYNPLVLSADLTVTPGTISGVTFEDASFVYDGTAKSLALEGTLPAGTTVSYSNNSRTDVGTQEVVATIAGSNYNTLTLTADLTVTEATIVGITLTNKNFIYDGSAHSLAITGSLPTGATVAYSNNSRTDVGAQKVTATITGSNYITLVLTADLTLSPATITDVTLEDESFVYDGTPKSLSVDGELPTGSSVVYTDNSRTDLGTQEVTATISRSNYITLVLTADLTVTAAPVAGITFTSRNFVYDGTGHSLSITGSLPTGTAVVYSNNERTDIGSQQVTATVSGSNYSTLVLTANLTVSPAPITGITFGDGTFVYDGTAHSLSITGTAPAGATVAYSNNGRTNAGTQEVTATITRSNFATLVLKADLTVAVAPITDVSFVDGRFAYDGTPHSLAINGSLPAGTTVTYNNNSRTGAGTQAVTATITGNNYIPLVLTAGLTVTKKLLFVVPEDGQFKYTGNDDPALAYQISGWAGGDSNELISGKLSREPGEAVGEYRITLGSMGAGPNYLLELQPTLFAIRVKYIVSLQNPDMVTVPWNTPFDEADKPTTVTAQLVDGSSISIGLVWMPSEYNQLEAGVYTVGGTLDLDEIENPQNFEPELLILVEDKLPPTDIQLSNNTFAADIDRNIAIGTFSTVDQQDNVHSYQLVAPDQNDGLYFRLEDNVLYWNSDEALAGRTTFTIKVSSTDRKGNTIEREFTLTRNRMPIEQIEVFTAFTPNGDGVNDTWGVRDLKYVQGGRMLIFDRSGRIIFTSENYEERWDGTFEGEEMPAGAYIWALEFQETGEVRKGTLALIRQ